MLRLKWTNGGFEKAASEKPRDDTLERRPRQTIFVSAPWDEDDEIISALYFPAPFGLVFARLYDDA